MFKQIRYILKTYHTVLENEGERTGCKNRIHAQSKFRFLLKHVEYRTKSDTIRELALASSNKIIKFVIHDAANSKADEVKRKGVSLF